MKKEKFKDITLTIPAHVQEALWWTSYGEGDIYADFDISLKVSQKGQLEIWDLLETWGSGNKPYTPEEAWAGIAEWRKTSDKHARIAELENELELLKREVAQAPVKKGWFK